MNIINQAIAKLDAMDDKETFNANYDAFVMPAKEKVYNDMESLIYHFKAGNGEIDPPKGEIYSAVEAANGELGFYIVSDGGRSPYRCHFVVPVLFTIRVIPK